MGPEIRSWASMIESSAALLQRRTGDDVDTWVARARAADCATEQDLRRWLHERDVTGYGQDAVAWAMFGYPEFFLKSAAELIDGQYADRPALRPITDAVLRRVASWDGVSIQARTTLIALQSPRRKFAQVVPATKTAVDVQLRLEDPPTGRLEAWKAPASEPLARRIRLRSIDDVDTGLEHWLARALVANR